MPGHRPRIADGEIEAALRRRGAVLIEGCRTCGKTWSARNVARSEARLDDEQMLLLAAADPTAVLQGAIPRLLDEWQNAPHLWNRIRRECDDRSGFGQFVLTGSAAPQDDITRHTGVGRISRVPPPTETPSSCCGEVPEKAVASAVHPVACRSCLRNRCE